MSTPSVKKGRSGYGMLPASVRIMAKGFSIQYLNVTFQRHNIWC